MVIVILVDFIQQRMVWMARVVGPKLAQLVRQFAMVCRPRWLGWIQQLDDQAA